MTKKIATKKKIDEKDFSLEELASIDTSVQKLGKLTHASPIQYELFSKNIADAYVTNREINVSKHPKTGSVLYLVCDYFSNGESIQIPLGSASFSQAYLNSVVVKNGRFKNSPYKNK